MNAVVSTLPVLALLLAGWTALSVVSVPILTLCVRSQARANARITRRLNERS